MPNRLLMLHPTRKVTLSREDFKTEADQIYTIYNIEIFCIEALMWYDMWNHLNKHKMLKAGSLMK